jgi:hypothetical protein
MAIGGSDTLIWKADRRARQPRRHAVLRWCDRHKIGEIADIEPLHVAAYIEALGKDFEKPSIHAAEATG